MGDETLHQLVPLTDGSSSAGTEAISLTGAARAELWQLLGEVAADFTMGDSSSVRVETAGALLQSILFCIEHQQLVSQDDPSDLNRLLTCSPAKALYRSGLRAVAEKTEAAKVLLRTAESGAVKLDNLAYHETLKELAVFFKKVDSRFFAHDIPCMIDYPLFAPVPETLKGIDWISAYLTRLCLENDFINRFPVTRVLTLLQAFCRDLREELINLYEPVATNALGLSLLGEDPLLLEISEADRYRLIRLLASVPAEELPSLLSDASQALCSGLGFTDAASQAYLCAFAADLAVRLRSPLRSEDLSELFLSFPEPLPKPAGTVTFQDRAPMEDEKLRAVLAEASDCRFVSDKVTLILREAHSIRDLAEILGVSFWGEECSALFDALNAQALVLLCRYVAERRGAAPGWASETDGSFGWNAI